MVLNGGDGAMNKQLADLIRDYQARVHEALVLMDRSGIRMPYSSFGWVKTDIPKEVYLMVMSCT